MNEDWIGSLGKVRDEILKDGKKIYIVNAGRMNHGKSSLFNSLLGKNVFAVDDIRTTIARQDAELGKNIVMIDTPGLDADIKDDDTAFDAYRRANLTVFVHTVKTGAVERDEIENIKRMEKAATSPEYFWRHFVLVFSNIDEYDAKNDEENEKLQKIEDESLKNIKDGCGEHEFPVFRVSNMYFREANEQHSDELKTMSGIDTLKDYIFSHLDEWEKEQGKLNEERFARAKREVKAQVQAKRNAIADELQAEESRLASRRKSIEDKLAKLQREVSDTASALSRANAERDKWEPLYHLEQRAKNIFRSVNLKNINCVVTPNITSPSSYEDGFSSRESAKDKADRLREKFCEECNWYFGARRSPSICESLGKEYSAQVYEKFSAMKSNLEDIIKKAGHSQLLSEEISIGVEVRMGGDDEWFGFSLDGKSLQQDKSSWSVRYEEHFDKFISRFHGKVHKTDVERSIDYYTGYEKGWFGGGKDVRRYCFSLDYFPALLEFDKVANNACEFLNRESHIEELHRQIMNGLERSFQEKIIQKLAQKI